MTRALKHAIHSTIPSTDATATFMFLSCWGGSMSINPYSILLSAYPHLCYKLGTIPRTELNYDNPESCLNQEFPLPQHTWDLHIIAVWNTAARLQLNSHDPTWLQGLSRDIPEAKWDLQNISNHPIRNAMHACMPGFKQCQRLLSDNEQIARTTSRSSTDDQDDIFVPSSSNPSLVLKVAN
jgi:hypothetical protein